MHHFCIWYQSYLQQQARSFDSPTKIIAHYSGRCILLSLPPSLLVEDKFANKIEATALEQ